MKKKLTIVVSLLLVMALSIGGTIAWLTDETDPVTNTFTVGNIDITLVESVDADEDGAARFKMVPGNEIEKDPVVTVVEGSEACWLFVKIDESANLDDFITYTVADGWTALADNNGVYYRTVAADATERAFSVLAGDKVTVNEDVTKEMMDAIVEDEALEPTLTFTAYAIQSDNIDDVADAWTEVSGS